MKGANNRRGYKGHLKSSRICTTVVTRVGAVYLKRGAITLQFYFLAWYNETLCGGEVNIRLYDALCVYGGVVMYIVHVFDQSLFPARNHSPPAIPSGITGLHRSGSRLNFPRTSSRGNLNRTSPVIARKCTKSEKFAGRFLEIERRWNAAPQSSMRRSVPSWKISRLYVSAKSSGHRSPASERI